MLRLDPGTSRERNCTIKNTLELWNVLCCLKVKGDLQCLTCQGCNYRYSKLYNSCLFLVQLNIRRSAVRSMDTVDTCR